MTAIHVTTQAELDAALNNPTITYAEHEIIICNTDGKWITIFNTDDWMLTLYKALPADGTTGKRYGHPVEWPTGGGIVECDDWDPELCCGGGLHLSPTPWQARQYLDGNDQRGARFLECRAQAAEVIPLRGDKVKAQSVVVVREVDVDGDPVAGGEAR